MFAIVGRLSAFTLAQLLITQYAVDDGYAQVAARISGQPQIYSEITNTLAQIDKSTFMLCYSTCVQFIIDAQENWCIRLISKLKIMEFFCRSHMSFCIK